MTSPAKPAAKRAGVACQVKPETEGLHLAHKKPENKYGFIPFLVMTLSLRNVWGFLTGLRELLHYSNERLEYYAARGVASVMS